MTATAQFTLFPTPVGTCAIAWRGGKVCGSHLPEATPELTEQRIAKRAGGAVEAGPADFVKAAIDAILELLDGKPNDLTAIRYQLHKNEAVVVLKTYNTNLQKK